MQEGEIVGESKSPLCFGDLKQREKKKGGGGKQARKGRTEEEGMFKGDVEQRKERGWGGGHPHSDLFLIQSR